MASQKENIIELINKIENSDVLNKLESLLFQYQFEEVNKTQLSEEQLVAELKIALLEIEQGKLTTTKDLKEEVKTW